MGPFAIVRVQSNTLAIDEHSVPNMMLTERATLVLGNEPSTNDSQSILVKNDPPTHLNANEQNTERDPIEYAVDWIISHEVSDECFCYRGRWYGYSTEHETLEPREHMSQFVIYC